MQVPSPELVLSGASTNRLCSSQSLCSQRGKSQHLGQHNSAELLPTTIIKYHPLPNSTHTRISGGSGIPDIQLNFEFHGTGLRDCLSREFEMKKRLETSLQYGFFSFCPIFLLSLVTNILSHFPHRFNFIMGNNNSNGSKSVCPVPNTNGPSGFILLT